MTPTCRTAGLIVALLLATANHAESAQPSTPSTVVAAVLKADSTADVHTILELIHPASMTEYRDGEIEWIKSLGNEILFQKDMKSVNECRKERANRALPSILGVFAVPSLDSLSRTAPESVFVRSYRHEVIERNKPTTWPYMRFERRVVGHVVSNDTLAYVVVEVKGPARTLPDDGVRTVRTVKHFGQWRVMLGGVVWVNRSGMPDVVTEIAACSRRG